MPFQCVLRAKWAGVMALSVSIQLNNKEGCSMIKILDIDDFIFADVEPTVSQK